MEANSTFNNISYIAQGIPVTIAITVVALCVGAILGVVLAILRYQKVASFPITIFISIIRGTPILLQLSFFYFVMPTLFPVTITAFWAGCITLGINSSAYIAEILRSGIESLPRGQFEIAKALHIPIFYMWKDIIIPQVIRSVFPALISEVTVLLKETALVSVIGELDVMRRSQLIAAREFDYIVPLCIAGVVYYLLVMCIERVGVVFEKRWGLCLK